MAALSIGAPSNVFGAARRKEVLPHLLSAAQLIRSRLLDGDAGIDTSALRRD